MLRRSVFTSTRQLGWLLFTSGLFWIFYTGVTLTTYAEGVLSDMKGDIAVYFRTNEEIAEVITKTLPILMEEYKGNQDFKLESSHQFKAYGLNLDHDHYAEVIGTMLTDFDSIHSANYNLLEFWHLLDHLWASADDKAPQGFFVSYMGNKPYVYHKLRFVIESPLPELSPERYRGKRVPKNFDQTFLTALHDSYPTNKDQVGVVTPIFLNNKLVADVGVELDIKSLMLSSLGPWLSRYMAVDIEYRDQVFSMGESKFFPSIFNQQDTFRDITITTYIQWGYITEYVLPWFLVLILVMSAVYFILSKHKKAADTLSTMIKTDELTGLYNKRVLNELNEFNIEFGDVFFLDINDFKPINDIHGHKVGDIALQFMGKTLLRSVRASDVCVRIGGDEFLVITGGKMIDPDAFIDYLKKSISEPEFFKDLHLSSSIGHARFQNLNELKYAISRADEAMYVNKRSRRN